MQTPTVNAQQAGLAAASADMNSYAAACQFLLAPPMVRATGAATPLTALTVTDIAWSAPAKDNDGTWVSTAATRFTLATQGFYEVGAHVAVTATASNFAEGWILLTTGPNAPGGAGVTTTCWHASATSGSLMCLHIAGIIPQLCYVGDFIKIQVQSDLTTSVTAASCDYSHRMVST